MQAAAIRLGQAPLAPFWQRSHSPRQAIAFLMGLVQARLHLQVPPGTRRRPIILVAGDTQAEAAGCAGGYLLLDGGDSRRVGGWIPITPGIRRRA